MCGIQGLAAVTWMHSYGAYTLHLQEEFGWSMSVLSLAFAITRLESGLLGPIQGWLVDKYGPRLIAIVGTLIFSIGFLYLRLRQLDSFLLCSIRFDRFRIEPWRFRNTDGVDCELV